MSTHSILLIDLGDVASSFNALALYVNANHILEADENNDHPVEDVANSLSQALNTPVTKITVTEKALAKASAYNDGNLPDFLADVESGDVDYDEWCQGYNHKDVLRAVQNITDHLPLSKEDIGELLQTLDRDYRAWQRDGEYETALATLINVHLKTYQLVQNSSTQEELDAIIEQYDWAQPLFQTMNDLIDGKLKQE